MKKLILLLTVLFGAVNMSAQDNDIQEEEVLVKVEKDYKWGFIDKSGKAVVPIIYDYVSDFKDGLAGAEKDNKWYVIDKSGNNTFDFSATQSSSQQKDLVEVLEVTPSFVGGTSAYNQWVEEHLIFPENVYGKNIKGRVVASYVIEKDGTISNVDIVQSVHPLVDKAVVRMLSSMPKWNPGTQNGQPVRVKMNWAINVNFE